jgi:transcriptional regulator with XRE-family HTH domain
MEQIVYRLKNARKMKGLSLRAAAKELGMSHEGLRKFESGKLKIDGELLIKFAKFYDVKIDYLVPSTHRPKIEFGEIHYHKISKKF